MEAAPAQPNAVRQIATVAEFQQVLGQASSKLVIVNFTAVWSGPCHRVALKFNQLAQDNPQAMFVKVDVDENIETAASHGINCMPTFVFYKNHEKIDELIGANEEVLMSKMTPLLANSTA